MISKHENYKDPSLDTLLDLNGEIFPMDNGYWTKFEVFRVKESKHIPHGIKYSLTLHDKYNKRIFGFDNAHAFKSKTKNKKYRIRKVTWDHIHHHEVISPYEFETASQLLVDFWDNVDRIIGNG